MFDKAYELHKKKYEHEDQMYTVKKIVRCEYCGKQSRFGDGTCPHCGAMLILPKNTGKEE